MPQNKQTSNIKTSRLNSTENRAYHINSSKNEKKCEKRSVSPSFYYHQLETFENVMKRLEKKGTSAEKPRRAFH